MPSGYPLPCKCSRHEQVSVCVFHCPQVGAVWGDVATGTVILDRWEQRTFDFGPFDSTRLVIATLDDMLRIGLGQMLRDRSVS